MNQTLVYIGDSLLDLYPDTIVALTKKANEVGDVSTINLNYTNQFKVPATPNNDTVFEHSRLVSSDATLPYRFQNIKVVQNGIEIIAEGVGILKKAGKDYQIFILSGAADFFDAIDGYKLTDLPDLIDSFDPDTMMNETTGVFFPVVNYGDFDGTTIPDATNLPSIYYHTFIDYIFTFSGYAKSGDIFTNDKYLKLVVPYSRKDFIYPSSFTNTFLFDALVIGSTSFISPGANTAIIFGNETKASDYYNNSTGRFTNSSSVTIRAYFTVSIPYTFSGGTTFDIDLMENGSVTVDTATGNTSGGTLQLTGMIVLAPTDYVEVIVKPATGTIIVTAASFSCYYVDSPEVGDTVNWMKFAPDMLIKDFLKDFAARFGLIFTQDSGTVTVKGIDEIITDIADAQDWTEKRDTSEPDEIAFNYLDYAQTNYFLYDSKDDLTDETTGRGSLDIDNDQLKDNKELYKSIFATSSMEQQATILCAKIPIYDTSTSRDLFDNDCGFRLLLARDKYGAEANVNGISSYKVLYWEDANQTYSMNWQDFLTDHYTYLTAVLQKAKLVTRRYNLTEMDFNRIDFLTPVFDTDSHYLLNTVGPFVPGRLTKVEILKL